MTLLNRIISFISYNKYNFHVDLLMAYSLLIFMGMVEHLLQYLLIDLCQLQILSLLGIMVINVSIRNVLKTRKRAVKDTEFYYSLCYCRCKWRDTVY